MIRGLATVYPWAVDPDRELDQALAFLDVPLGAGTLQRAGYGAGILSCAMGLSSGVFLQLSGQLFEALAVGTILLAVTCALSFQEVPKVLATAQRTRALGSAPGLVSRAVLRMKLAPTPERAAEFASETSSGVLASSLAAHVDRAAGTKRSGLSRFGTAWAAWFPALRRALLLVESAGSAPPSERGRTLDRALRVTLEGTRTQMASFASSIRGPAIGLYAFGVLLPLSLVALLPAATVAGIPATGPAFVVIYDVLLPLVLVGVGGWLVVRRPVAFPPQPVSSSHPAVPDSSWPAILTGSAVGIAAWFGAAWGLPPWSPPLAALGSGVGTTLVVRYHAVKAVRERAGEIESGLVDALYLVGRRVDEGEAVETALHRAAADLTGPVETVLSAAVANQRRLGADVHDAFLGEHGALSTVPSPRARSIVTLLVLSAREGQPAGTALISMADHLESLQTVEREAREELDAITATLGNTAAVFGPLVAGATVAMASHLATQGVFSGGPLSSVTSAPVATATAGVATGTAGQTTTLSPELLGRAVGCYVLLSTAILTTLSTSLERGFDRALVGYRVGVALLLGTITYFAAIEATGTFV
jgi:hypothetical protein